MRTRREHITFFQVLTDLPLTGEVPTAKASGIVMKDCITVSITGAAGQIGYALLFRIASGAIFGPDQPVHLNLIEIEPAMKSLAGTVMDLELDEAENEDQTIGPPS